jgi:hypothetical protein
MLKARKSLVVLIISLTSFGCHSELKWHYPRNRSEPMTFKRVNEVRIYCPSTTHCIAHRHAHTGQEIPRLKSEDGWMIPGEGALCNTWGGNERILEDDQTNQGSFCTFKDKSALALSDIR